MLPVVRCKPGVQFDRIAPGGIKILAALEYAADQLDRDLTITSGTDGAHSGPDDPHHRGEAYDVRISDLPDPEAALAYIKEFLDIPKLQDQGEYFFAWIENAGKPNQHVHVQVRKGTTYPPDDLLLRA